MEITYTVYQNYGKFTNKAGKTTEIVMIRDSEGYMDTFTDKKELAKFLSNKTWKYSTEDK